VSTLRLDIEKSCQIDADKASEGALVTESTARETATKALPSRQQRSADARTL